MSFDLSINFLCKIVNNVAKSRPKSQSCLVKLKTEAEELNIRKKGPYASLSYSQGLFRMPGIIFQIPMHLSSG